MHVYVCACISYLLYLEQTRKGFFPALQRFDIILMQERHALHLNRFAEEQIGFGAREIEQMEQHSIFVSSRPLINLDKAPWIQ